MERERERERDREREKVGSLPSSFVSVLCFVCSGANNAPMYSACPHTDLSISHTHARTHAHTHTNTLLIFTLHIEPDRIQKDQP